MQVGGWFSQRFPGKHLVDRLPSNRSDGFLQEKRQSLHCKLVVVLHDEGMVRTSDGTFIGGHTFFAEIGMSVKKPIMRTCKLKFLKSNSCIEDPFSTYSW